MNSAVRDGVLVIGYGNSLRTDDAVGLHVARAAREAGFDAIETCQLVPELAGRMAAARLVVFVDCDVTLAPGETAVTAPPRAEGCALHDPASPGMLVELAGLLYGHVPEARCIGVGPASLEMGEELTPEVARSVPAVLGLLRVESARVPR